MKPLFNYAINEGASGFAAVKQNNPEIWNNIVKAFKVKKLNFENVKSSKIVEESPEAAFKYGGEEGDKYFKLWMRNEKIAFVTWANTMIDTKFRWNAKAKNAADKRDNKDIIGTKEDVLGYLKSTPYYKKCTSVFRIPFDAFGPAATKMVNAERSKYEEDSNFLKSKENTLSPGEYLRRFHEFENFIYSEIFKKFEYTVRTLPYKSKNVRATLSQYCLDLNEPEINCSDKIIYDSGNPKVSDYYANIYFKLQLPELNVKNLGYGLYGNPVTKDDERIYNGYEARYKSDVEKRVDDIIKTIKASFSQEDLEYYAGLFKTYDEVRDTLKKSDVNKKYNAIIFQKLSNLFPDGSYAKMSIVDTDTANAFVSKNQSSLNIYIPYDPHNKGKLLFTKRRESKNWIKILRKEIMDYASEIFYECAWNDEPDEGNYCVYAYFKKSFLDSIK